MSNELALIESILKTFGIPGVVIWALWAGHIVLGKHYREMVKERDFWRTIALKSLNAAEMTATMATTNLPQGE